jgi:hypothetical protein
MKFIPRIRPATAVAGKLVTPSSVSIQLVSLATGATGGALARFLGGVGPGSAPGVAAGATVATAGLSEELSPLEWDILARMITTAAPAASTNTTRKAITAIIGLLSFTVTPPPPRVSESDIFFSVNFVPVRMNFGSFVVGACGATIFWKHVGHSITVPLCVESHTMCWPHTGQAYLNSLMLGVPATFHIPPMSAIHIFGGLCDGFHKPLQKTVSFRAHLWF